MRRDLFIRLACCVLASSSASCALATTDEIASEDRDVAYLTTRIIESRDDGTYRYTVDVSALSGGRCRVRVPLADDEAPEFRRSYPDSVESVVAGLGDGPVVFYVHGYNIGFERACEDAAQLARQTDFEGRLLLFSWPASTTVLTYSKDARKLAASMPDILGSLEMVVDRYGADQVNVIAHSMGSRIVNDAIDGGLRLPGDVRVSNLVLIAPDLDRETFVDALPTLKTLFDDISVLVSDDDRLLLLSETVNFGARLGQADDVAIDGAEIIDVTGVEDPGFGGHVYHLTSAEVGSILRRLLSD